MSDMKDEIQAIFEELVSIEYDTDYWNISDLDQDRLYKKAMQEYRDRLADRADYLRDIEKERPR